MEIAFKILITIVLTVCPGYGVYWTWTHQIDPKETCKLFVKQWNPFTKKIAIRDENKIYKNGNPVGNISATVFEEDESVLFPQLTEAWSIQLHDVIEYKRHKLKVISISRKVAKKVNKFSVKNNVLEYVKCEKLKDE